MEEFRNRDIFAIVLDANFDFFLLFSFEKEEGMNSFAYKNFELGTSLRLYWMQILIYSLFFLFYFFWTRGKDKFFCMDEFRNGDLFAIVLDVNFDFFLLFSFEKKEGINLFAYKNFEMRTFLQLYWMQIWIFSFFFLLRRRKG